MRSGRRGRAWLGRRNVGVFGELVTTSDAERRQHPRIDGGEVVLCVKHEHFIEAITH